MAKAIFETMRADAAVILNPDREMTEDDDAFANSLGFVSGDALRSAMQQLGQGVIGVETAEEMEGDARAFRSAVARLPVYPE